MADTTTVDDLESYFGIGNTSSTTSSSGTSSSTTATTGAAAMAGAQIGSVIPGVGTAIGAAIGTIVSSVSSLGFKGKTQHMNWNDANSITNPLATAITQDIQNDVPGSVASITNTFPDLAVSAINNCDWWKVGNNQETDVPGDISKDPTLMGTIWRVLMWAFRNAHDAYYASAEIFTKSLYPSLISAGGTSLVQVIDAAIAKVCSQTAGAGITSLNISTSTSSSSNTASTTTTASLSIASIILLAGAFIAIVFGMIKKGKLV